jgi:hypothetical protein
MKNDSLKRARPATGLRGSRANWSRFPVSPPLLLVALILRLGGGLSQAVDFGFVMINQGTNRTYAINNPFPHAANYQFEPPTPPFFLRGGNASGVISPGQSVTVTFGFDGPATLTPTTTVPAPVPNSPGPVQVFDQSLSFTISDPTTSTYNASSIHLEASLYGPQPVNVVKRLATFKESIAATLAGLNPTQYLFTTIGFNSLSGNIFDLDLYDKIQIREVLAYSSGITLCPTCPLTSLPGYPNGCQTSTVPTCTLNPPWQPGAYIIPKLQLMISPNLRQNGFKWEDGTGTTMYFMDAHGIGDFLAQLQPGTNTVIQEYQWTAPWLVDSNACPVWVAMMDDVITLTVTRSSAPIVPPVWGCDVTVSLIADKTTSPGTWQPNISGTFIIGLLQYVMASSSETGMAQMGLSWVVAGSTLQYAPASTGPWIDIPSSTNVLQMNIPLTNDLSARFFRLKLPSGN